MPIEERIAKAVSEWPQWSKAERKRLPEIIEEVMTYCKTGVGNEFIRDWCKLNLDPLFKRKGDKPSPSVPDLFNHICELTRLVSETCAILEDESPGAAECGYWNHDQKMVYEDAKELLRSHSFVCPED